MATDKTYPDAIVTNGVISDLITGDILPSYEGLVLADCAGRMAILFTTLTLGADGPVRKFELVHFGSQLSTTEIQRFMKEKG